MKTYRWRIFFKILFNYVIPLGLGIAILWYLTAIYQRDPSEFWPHASLVIASIAAIFAGISALIANRSLELTRNSIRPFLYTAGSINIKRVGKYITLTFNIHNSGSLPGEDVHVDIDFFDEDEEVTKENLSNRYTPPTRELEFPLLFPNSVYYENYVLDLEQKDDLALWNNIEKGKTKCRVRIMYKSPGRKHITIQTKKLAKREWEATLVTTPILPQKWE